jgi:hypothetical protein
MNPVKLVWERHSFNSLTLYAKFEYPHGARTATGLLESHLLPVQEWCEKTKCGRRMSFDMFKFKNESEMTAFLLVWG